MERNMSIGAKPIDKRTKEEECELPEPEECRDCIEDCSICMIG